MAPRNHVLRQSFKPRRRLWRQRQFVKRSLGGLDVMRHSTLGLFVGSRGKHGIAHGLNFLVSTL